MAAGVPDRKRRILRRVEEKLRIVKLTLEPGASVASVALAYGVNANQVFRWKRQYERGELDPRRSKPASTGTGDHRGGGRRNEDTSTPGVNTRSAVRKQYHHRVFPDGAAEHRRAADPAVIRAVLESLSLIDQRNRVAEPLSTKR